MVSDHMRWGPSVPDEDERLRPHYGPENPLPMSVRAEVPLGAEGEPEDAVAWLEGEMDRLLGRPSHPGGRFIPIPPERRGLRVETAYVDETQYVRADRERPRVVEVEILVRTADGLERRIVVESPEDVETNVESEEIEITSFMDPYPRYMPGRFMELIMKVRYPRRVREETRRWIPPERITFRD